MSAWSEDKEEPESWDWDAVKQGVLVGIGCVVAVIAWMAFARPGEEAPSSRGFNMGSAGGAPSAASGRPFASRPKTSLDMVSSQIGDGPPGVISGIDAGAAANQVEIARPLPAASAPAGNAAAAPPAPVSAAGEAEDLAAAGVPTDAKGLRNLGAKEGLLSALAAKMLDHPKIMAAIFNNKQVVDAFMSRARVKENCESGGALKSYLSDPSSGGMTTVFPVIQQALSRPATASALVSALAGTEMVKRVAACPSLQALSNDKTAVVSIAMSNPKALGLLMDPRGVAALAANAQATGVLSGLQSKMGGAN
ncbi:MAG: hypothetical protein AAB268_06225 [Elusimicrobiota bacterium]